MNMYRQNYFPDPWQVNKREGDKAFYLALAACAAYGLMALAVWAFV